MEKLNLRTPSNRKEPVKKVRSVSSSTDSGNYSENRKKSKISDKESKIYVTTNSVLYQPIVHSKECLESLDSDEVKPCSCLKTVAANRYKYSPSKQANVMESIFDDEIADFTSNSQKKKLNRTNATIPYNYALQYGHVNGNERDSVFSDTLKSDFSHYDKVSHPLVARSMTTFQYNGNSHDSLNSDNHRASSIIFSEASNTSSINDVCTWRPQGDRKMNQPIQYSKVKPKNLRINKDNVTRMQSVESSKILKRTNSMEKIEILDDFKSMSSGSKESRLNSISPQKDSPNLNEGRDSTLPSYPNLPSFSDTQFKEHPKSSVVRAATINGYVSEL